ncbi:hypothetical protein [Arthrobacter sp. Br18]|uniref:hypothetical protein n=1 Tax=Arthrobacter sp. Br18 TaxID=1312954 RepID=UPI00047D97FF|nr:hypothetical protein [Arthrobacter sp. Br18]
MTWPSRSARISFICAAGAFITAARVQVLFRGEEGLNAVVVTVGITALVIGGVVALLVGILTYSRRAP